MKGQAQQVVLIGVDCACNPKDVGLARAEYSKGSTATVTDVVCGGDLKPIPSKLAEWMQGAEHTLLALDAPLGWPAPLGAELHSHAAGEPLSESADDLFRRETDRNIQQRFRKTPLEVGADRIARTARAALALLGELRHEAGKAIPLAWVPGSVKETSAIEVYPAGTLLAHKMPAAKYKDKKKEEAREVRERIVTSLAAKLRLPSNRDLLMEDADCLDAVVCLLAAVDFVNGDAVPPSDKERARKEGWIWVHR